MELIGRIKLLSIGESITIKCVSSAQLNEAIAYVSRAHNRRFTEIRNINHSVVRREPLQPNIAHENG